MNDLISRQAAIDVLEERLQANGYLNVGLVSELNRIIGYLMRLPSAQPERLTDDDFETIRTHLNAYKEKLCNQRRWKEAEEYQRIIDRLLGSAERLDEWCTDCKEYDHEKMCCPRFNRVSGDYENWNIDPDVPPIDLVKVLRCKDCRYYEETNDGIGTCLLTSCGAFSTAYCAWGSAKGEE